MLEARPMKCACAGRTSGVSASDRLSTLPDCVLHIVLSFLPARHAVQTSVLSWRWRDLWCSMPCINIDEREFEVGGYRQIKEEWDKFEDFTTNQLLFHSNSVSLDRFRIYAHSHSQRPVDKWIRLGIKCCPAVLDIAIPYYIDDAPLKLPHLGPGFCRLKKLTLSKDIMSATLKRLVVDTCFDLANAARPMVITAPSLAYLKLVIQDTIYRHGISVCNAASLVKAKIYIQYTEDFPVKYQSRLLGGLFNATSLELNGFETMATHNEKSDGFPVFPNLRALSLERCFLEDEYDMDSILDNLGSFLENAPCLEKLTLQCCMFCADPGWEWNDDRKSISLKCQDGKTLQCPKLKMIEVLYKHDMEHLQIEFLWGITRRLPDASIKLTKI
ncbi:hypothetical protein ACP70R_029248 [Stipagrostis hirtigluma subsp. patula]